MKYDLIGGERDGDRVSLTHECKYITLCRMPIPTVTLGELKRDPEICVADRDEYSLREFSFYGRQYKCYALSVLTDLQARNIAIKRVMA